MRLTTVRPDELPPYSMLFGGSALVGMCAFFVFFLVSMLMLFVTMPIRSAATEPLLMVIALALTIVIPMWILIAVRRAVATMRRAVIISLGAGTGTALFGGAMTFAMRGGLIFPVVASLFSGTFILTIVGWLVINRLFGPVRLVDGKSCPACGYCLLGCESMNCPECGRAFTYEEIGTTEAEFKERQAIE